MKCERVVRIELYAISSIYTPLAQHTCIDFFLLGFLFHSLSTFIHPFVFLCSVTTSYFPIDHICFGLLFSRWLFLDLILCAFM